MLQKWDSSSVALRFDACPHCGFAYGTGVQDNGDIGELAPEELWQTICHAIGVSSRTQLQTLVRDWPSTSSLTPSIFNYDSDPPDEIRRHMPGDAAP